MLPNLSPQQNYPSEIARLTFGAGDVLELSRKGFVPPASLPAVNRLSIFYFSRQVSSVSLASEIQYREKCSGEEQMMSFCR